MQVPATGPVRLIKFPIMSLMDASSQPAQLGRNLRPETSHKNTMTCILILTLILTLTLNITFNITITISLSILSSSILTLKMVRCVCFISLHTYLCYSDIVV